ncbi:MAG: hypothetical protein K2I56_05990 [Muribaculaceae bacterium]|nr:hypothetical protein [Muribaculaceae bacterium]
MLLTAAISHAQNPKIACETLGDDHTGYAEESRTFTLQYTGTHYASDIKWQLFVKNNHGDYSCVQQTENTLSTFHADPIYFQPDYLIENDGSIQAYVRAEYKLDGNPAASASNYEMKLITLPEFKNYNTCEPVPTLAPTVYTLPVFADFSNASSVEISYTVDGSVAGSRTFDITDNKQAFSIPDYKPSSDYRLNYKLSNTYGSTTKSIEFESPANAAQIVCEALENDEVAYAEQQYDFKLELPEAHKATDICWTISVLDTDGNYVKAHESDSHSLTFRSPALPKDQRYDTSGNHLTARVDVIFSDCDMECQKSYELYMNTLPDILSADYIFNRTWDEDTEAYYPRPPYSENYDISFEINYLNSSRLEVTAEILESPFVQTKKSSMPKTAHISFTDRMNTLDNYYTIVAYNSYGQASHTVLVKAYNDTSAEVNAEVNKTVATEEVYTPDGRRTDSSAAGMTIRRSTFTDGSSKSSKEWHKR